VNTFVQPACIRIQNKACKDTNVRMGWCAVTSWREQWLLCSAIGGGVRGIEGKECSLCAGILVQNSHVYLNMNMS